MILYNVGGLAIKTYAIMLATQDGENGPHISHGDIVLHLNISC